MLLFIIIVLDIICLDVWLMAGVFVIDHSQLPRHKAGLFRIDI